MMSPILGRMTKPRSIIPIMATSCQTVLLPRQRDEIELIASENIVSPRRARGAGLGADQQICRGLSGQALLRRLRVSSTIAETLAIERAKAVRLRLRQRAAAFGQPGQPGGVPGAAAAGRHLHGPRPAAGGHLTHGSPVNMSGKWFKPCLRRAPDDQRIDMDEVARIAASTSRS
jgi:glycine hydroxymethyltransferase